MGKRTTNSLPPAGALAVRGDGPAVQLDQDASQRQAHAQAVLGVGQRPIGLRAQIEHERLHRVGWDLQLTQYGDDTWRARLYVTGQRTRSSAAPRGSRRRGAQSSRRVGRPF